MAPQDPRHPSEQGPRLAEALTPGRPSGPVPALLSPSACPVSRGAPTLACPPTPPLTSPELAALPSSLGAQLLDTSFYGSRGERRREEQGRGRASAIRGKMGDSAKEGGGSEACMSWPVRSERGRSLLGSVSLLHLSFPLQTLCSEMHTMPSLPSLCLLFVTCLRLCVCSSVPQPGSACSGPVYPISIHSPFLSAPAAWVLFSVCASSGPPPRLCFCPARRTCPGVLACRASPSPWEAGSATGVSASCGSRGLEPRGAPPAWFCSLGTFAHARRHFGAS